MATLSGLITFVAGTRAKASEVTANFNTVKTFTEGISTGANIDAGAITDTKLGTAAVTSAKIAPGAVTDDKFATGLRPVNVAATAGSIGTPAVGWVASQTSNNTSEGLYLRNSANQWRAPWNMGWGLMGRSTKTSNQNITVANTYTDISGVSVTFTAVANRLYSVRAYVFVNVGSANTLELQLTDGGATLQYQQVAFTSIMGAAGNYAIVETITGFGAGSQTMKLRARADTVSPTQPQILGNVFAPSFMVITDLGPTGNPS